MASPRLSFEYAMRNIAFWFLNDVNYHFRGGPSVSWIWAEIFTLLRTISLSRNLTKNHSKLHNFLLLLIIVSVHNATLPCYFDWSWHVGITKNTGKLIFEDFKLVEEFSIDFFYFYILRKAKKKWKSVNNYKSFNKI